MSDALSIVRNDFLEFEDQILTEEHLQKAEEMLGETPEIREKCLQKLKNLIKEERSLNALTDENFLLRFLRAKKFDVEKTFDKFKRYYTQQQNYSAIFSPIQSSTLEILLKNNVFGFLPLRNNDGSAIFVLRIGYYDPCLVPFDDFLHSIILCIDWALQNPLNLIYGITVIEDMKGLTVNHVLQMTPSRVYCIMKVFLDCIPCRFKAFHIVNEPAIFFTVYELFNALLNDKVKSRLILHGSDMQSLHTYIPPFILPDEFGGYLGLLDNSTMSKLIRQHEKKFVENLKFGYLDPSKPMEEKYIPFSDVM